MNRIAEHREAAGLTQAQLAEKVGTDIGTISRYERGQDPRLSRAGQIAAALGVKLDDLYHGQDADTSANGHGKPSDDQAATALPATDSAVAAR